MLTQLSHWLIPCYYRILGMYLCVVPVPPPWIVFIKLKGNEEALEHCKPLPTLVIGVEESSLNWFLDIVSLPLDMESGLHLSCDIDIWNVFIFYFLNYGLTSVLSSSNNPTSGSTSDSSFWHALSGSRPVSWKSFFLFLRNQLTDRQARFFWQSAWAAFLCISQMFILITLICAAKIKAGFCHPGSCCQDKTSMLHYSE